VVDGSDVVCIMRNFLRTTRQQNNLQISKLVGKSGKIKSIVSSSNVKKSVRTCLTVLNWMT